MRCEFVGALVLALLCAMAVPAMANYGIFPVVTRTNDTINGSVYIGSVGPYGPCQSVSGSFEVPNGTVKWARLYTGVWGTTETASGWVNVTFNGNYTHNGLGPIHLRGVEDTNPNVWCTGCGKYWIYYDVTDLVNAGSTNSFTNTKINGSIDGPAYGTVLVVVLEGGDNPRNITYWINDGSDYAPGTTYFYGTVHRDFVAGANLTMVHLTAFDPPCANCLKFNGHELDTSMITSNTFDINSWDVYDYLSRSENHVWFNNGEDPYVSVTNAILVLERCKDETPPFTADHEPVPDATWVPRDTNISVHVKDYGAGVDEDTIVMTVNGDNVTGNISISGTPEDYLVIYDPPADFDFLQTVNVTINASDLASNVMPPDSYSFTIKGIDYWEPYITDLDPAPDATRVHRDTNISFIVKDDHDGVDINTIEMTVDGENVTENLIITGTPSNYTVVYDPPSDFDFWQVVNVTINASDLNETPNAMQYSYSFTIVGNKPDLIIKAVDAYHYDYNCTYPWFNLSNKVDVTVENTGGITATPSNVALYINDEFIGKKVIPDLSVGSNITETFEWTPIGCDCQNAHCNPQNYTLRAIADCDGQLDELEEDNNALTTNETAYWAGYSADEVLEESFHAVLRGGLLYTTGDGNYISLYNPGDSLVVNYNISLPSGADAVLARLNVYYTWSKYGYPIMEVSITNQTGTYIVPLSKSYNDRPCDSPQISKDYLWGDYVYDLTPYIKGSYTYTVTVKNDGNETNKSDFCVAAPGIVVLYQDKTMPLREFWILEGADILEGGHRPGAGNLALEECINNATFAGDINTDDVETATLGVVAPWGGSSKEPGSTNYLYFNGKLMGKGVYHGYHETYDKTINGVSMHVGGTNAQIGVNVTDVTECLNASDNRVGQGDDGDSMMVSNAIFVVEYKEEKPPAPFMIYGFVNDSAGAPVNGPNVTITNLNTGEELTVETIASSNYYQVVSSSWNVSAGNVLHFYASDNGNVTEFNHTVTAAEIDNGGFVQHIIISYQLPGICGDVTGDGHVRVSDGLRIIENQTFIGDPRYAVDPWAADVTGDGYVRVSDGLRIIENQTFIGDPRYQLTCRPF